MKNKLYQLTGVVLLILIIVVVFTVFKPSSKSSTISQSNTSTSGSTVSSEQGGAGSSYTIDQVAQHNSEANCWAAIDGKVYNLTSWINIHPGGAQQIISLCGTDATEKFHEQHGTERKPARELAEFLIGDLK